MVFWKKRKETQTSSIKEKSNENNGKTGGDASFSTASSSSGMASGIQGIKNIVAVASGKGGVGKSTVAANLALALQKMGLRVGLLDADIYGPSQPSLLGSQQERAKGLSGNLIPLEKWGVKFVSMGVLFENDGPVVWRAPMVTKVLQQFLKNVLWGELDFLLIDLPPGTGDVQITLSQQAQLTGAVIVTTPQDIAVQIAKKGLQMFEQVNIPILGIIENMSGFACPHCSEVTPVFQKGGGEKLAQECNTLFLGDIPLDPEVMASGEEGVPVVERNASSPPATSFFRVAEKMREALERAKLDAVGSLPQEYTLSSDGGQVFINWGDNHHSIFSPYNLRIHCPCANCVDEHTGKRILNVQNVPLDLKASHINPIGRYGLSIRFSDQHSTGIYKFTKLKELCECPQCLSSSKYAKESQESFSV